MLPTARRAARITTHPFPDGTYCYSGYYGYHNGWLSGPSGTDFDLYLWKWDGSKWVTVACSISYSSEEEISYYGSPGYYVWRMESYSGSGGYDFLDTAPVAGLHSTYPCP